MDASDWFEGLRNEADRLRNLADELDTQPDPKPPVVKRQPGTPSGAGVRAQRARNAYHRVQSKKRGAP